jgi:ABC-2 type transport system ATP-binding protein
LRILAGFLGATSGRVRIAGLDIAEARLEALAKIGYMPETSPLYPEMKVREYLAFRAELKRVARRARAAEVGRALERAKVDDMAEVQIGHLSKGYRQRVGLADALLGSPPLLILDEPTAGLDPNQIREVRALIASLGETHTVLLSTHILSEVEASCSSVVVIANGRLVAKGSIDAIRGKGGHELALTVRGDRATVREIILAVEGVRELSIEPRGEEVLRVVVSLTTSDEASAATAAEQITRALAEGQIAIREVATAAASLEQVFSTLTSREATVSGKGAP